MTPILIALGLALALALAAVASLLWRRNRQLQREQFIRQSPLPKGLFEKLQQLHPQLSLKDCQLVAQGLRQFFLAYSKSGRRFVAMPSQVVDDLWHEFILHTRSYDAFCRHAFGGFLHHTPAVTLAGVPSQQNEGLRRCWRHACAEENIDPRQPTRLPLLFALDTKFGIAGGFRYVADCRGVKRDDGAGGAVTHCGSSFCDPSVDGCTDGLGDGGADGGSGGDGGGCGGGGD